MRRRKPKVRRICYKMKREKRRKEGSEKFDSGAEDLRRSMKVTSECHAAHEAVAA